MSAWLLYLGFCCLWSYFAVSSAAVELSLFEQIVVVLFSTVIMAVIIPIIPLMMVVGYYISRDIR